MTELTIKKIKCPQCDGSGMMLNLNFEHCQHWTPEEIEKNGVKPGDCKACRRSGGGCQGPELVWCDRCNSEGSVWADEDGDIWTRSDG